MVDMNLVAVLKLMTWLICACTVNVYNMCILHIQCSYKPPIKHVYVRNYICHTYCTKVEISCIPQFNV